AFGSIYKFILFFFQAEDGIRDRIVTGVQTCALPIFAADLAAAACLLFSSLFGIPLSTTHTKTSAIMGVGAVKRLSAINFGVVKEIGRASCREGMYILLDDILLFLIYRMTR